MKIDYEFIGMQDSIFLKESKSNLFYEKNVFFTQELKGSKYIAFQIIGNLGGWADDELFDNKTNYVVISDFLVLKLRINSSPTQITELEHIIEKYNRFKKIQIISESALLQYVEKRCLSVSDTVTLNLAKRLYE